jgi:hypothetical protein
MILEEMYTKYELCNQIKNGLLNKGYSHRDLGYVEIVWRQGAREVTEALSVS